jgi:hypothetical protein
VYLGGDRGWPTHLVVQAQPPLRWVAPNLVAPDSGAPSRDRFLLRSDAFLRAPRVEVVQSEKTLWRGRLVRLAPGRSAHIPARWTRRVDPEAGPIAVRVVGRGD